MYNMKNKIFLLLILSFLTLLFSGCKKEEVDNGYYCNEQLDLLNSYMNMPRPADSYNYPIRPCMNKWKELASTEEKIKACAIPIERLKTMSTQAVIQAIWEYPFFVEISSSIGMRNAQKDFETLFYSNNAYKELLERKDAGILLLKRYKLMDAICKGKLIWIPPFELLFSQPNFIQQLTTAEKKKLVAIALEKNKLRVASGFFDELCEFSTLMLIARIMIYAEYPPFLNEVIDSDPLKRFIDTSMFFVKTMEELRNLQQLMLDYGKEFINEKQQ